MLPSENEKEYDAAMRKLRIADATVRPDELEHSAASVVSAARYRRFLAMKAAAYRNIDVSDVAMPTVAAPAGTRIANFVAARRRADGLDASDDEDGGAADDALDGDAEALAAAAAAADAEAFGDGAADGGELPMLTHKPPFDDLDQHLTPKEQKWRSSESKRLLEHQQRLQQSKFASDAGRKAYAQRQTLPSYRMRDEIVRTCNSARVVVIAAETGA